MVYPGSYVSYLIHPRLLKIMFERPPIASTQHLKTMATEDTEISSHLISIQNRQVLTISFIIHLLSACFSWGNHIRITYSTWTGHVSVMLEARVWRRWIHISARTRAVLSEISCGALVLPATRCGNTSVMPWLFLSKSFPVHQSFYWIISAQALKITRSFVVVQEVSCQPVILEVWADSWTILCGIYGGQYGNGIGFSLSTFRSFICHQRSVILTVNKIKGEESKVVAVHVTKAYMGSRGLAPLILNFGTGGRWMSFNNMLGRTILLFPSLPCPICRALTLSAGLFLFHVNSKLRKSKR